MAIYRNVRIAFWTDTKIVDEFTPEDRYFYLYLFTNPHTNLCGCYELSIKQASTELGYDVNAINTLLRRFDEVHNVIKFSQRTKEVLILNWHKYNWTSSEKFRKSLLAEIEQIKNEAYKEYLLKVFHNFHNNNTVSIPYPYGSDTTVAVTVTDTDSDTDAVTDLMDMLTADEIHKLYETYQNAGELIDMVQTNIENKQIHISKPYNYIVGFAINKGWLTYGRNQ